MPPTLNGFQVVDASVAEPSTGVWTAVVRAQMGDTDVPALEDTQMSLDIEGVEWVGTVRRAALDFDTASIFIVGGSGKLGITGSVSDYVQPTVRTIVTGIFDESGDVVASTSDQSVLNARYLHFHKSALPRGTQLSSAIGAEAVWYTLRNGEVEFAAPDLFEAFAGNDEDFLEQRIDAPDRSIRYTADTPLLAPRITFEGRSLSYVETVVTPDSLQQVAYT